LAFLDGFKPAVPGTVQLLERLIVEFGQALGDRSVQLGHVEKALIAQGG
jgi:hypothetical protein